MFTKTIAIGLVIALVSGFWIQNTAYAGDKEWATAGKILAGVVGLAAVQQIAKNQRHDGYNRRTVYYGAPTHRQKRVYYHRAPRRIHRQRRIWVPGRHITEEVKVWVPGVEEKIWVPPRYERQWVADRRGGYWEEVLVEEGHWRYERQPGHFEIHTQRRWVSGYWKNI